MAKLIKFSSFKSDLKREYEGDWIAHPAYPGGAFHVSSFNKPEYEIAKDLLGQRIAREYRGKPRPTSAESQAFFGVLYAEHILHDWRGLEFPYSPELARECLPNPEYRLLYEVVEWCANQLAVVEVEFVEDAAKNSEQPSAGGSKGKQLATG